MLRKAVSIPKDVILLREIYLGVGDGMLQTITGNVVENHDFIIQPSI